MSRLGLQTPMHEEILPRHILITGGTRSGKSKFAEDLAGKMGSKVIYLATAEAFDAEMQERIQIHQQRRPHDWLTIEEPIAVVRAIAEFQKGTTILLDCLTLFLSNIFYKYEELSANDRERAINNEVTSLAKVINESGANIIIVSNELGWGLVPENASARLFRDLAGLANQTVAAACDEVYLVVSGIPVRIKGRQGCLNPLE